MSKKKTKTQSSVKFCIVDVSHVAVDAVLNITDVDVIVYQGQLDLICDTKGTTPSTPSTPPVQACSDRATESISSSHTQFHSS